MLLDFNPVGSKNPNWPKQFPNLFKMEFSGTSNAFFMNGKMVAEHMVCISLKQLDMADKKYLEPNMLNEETGRENIIWCIYEKIPIMLYFKSKNTIKFTLYFLKD